MWALGFGAFFFGYGFIYYGIALATGQHKNLMYCLFHTGTVAGPGTGSGTPVTKSGTPAQTPYTGQVVPTGSTAGQPLTSRKS